MSAYRKEITLFQFPDGTAGIGDGILENAPLTLEGAIWYPCAIGVQNRQPAH
jgi:hypothetical protein